MTKRILFLMSDTGGGHRAAAEAISDALSARYGDIVQTKLVDVFRQTSFPLNYMPEFYPWWVSRSKTAWGVSYNLSNTRRRVKVLSHGLYLTNRTRLMRMARENPANVVVCVHSITAQASMQAFMTLEQRPPFMTVVTDLVSTHMFWFDARVERCLVPTQAAYEHGLDCGLTHEQLRVTGLPVHPSFAERLKDKSVAREELGWNPALPTVLMVSGGEGMGSIYETARAINAKQLDCQLVIIAGKNKQLKEKLESSEWNQPTLIYPFVTNMPVLMAAADVLVTKAGPATISEASIAGLPMILSDAIPGQETGNVDFVVENNAGVFAPEPDIVANALGEWLDEGQEGLKRRAENARRIARPNAVWEIAEEIWEYAHHPMIATNRPNLWQIAW